MSFQAKMVTNNAITAIVENKPYQVDSSHPNFKMLLDALKLNDSDTFISLLDVNKGTEVYVAKDSLGNDTNIKVTEDGVTYKGRVLHNVLVDRILSYRDKGLPIDDMVKFLENLMQNPSSSSVEELFDFMENKNLPITENGNLIGYKAVQSDFWSKTAGKTVLSKGKVNESGRIFNGVGEEIECERNQVDDDRRNECSNGLHIGGLSYATVTFKGSNDKVVLVEVNPKDVVSVPKDYNAQKLRACAYKVIGEYVQPLDSVSTRQFQDEEDYDYSEFEDDDEDEYDVEYSCDCCGFDCEDEGICEDCEFADEEEDNSISLSELVPGLTVTFSYRNESRVCEVHSVDASHFTGKLTKEDVNYDPLLNVNQYRCFLYHECYDMETV